MAHTAAPAPPSSSRCLYVSNLPPSFTEYNLVSLFSPHGKISRLDLIFHKSGPLKGRTKGYAFIEYAKQEDAMSAKVKVDGKAVGGRRIAIGWANAQVGRCGVADAVFELTNHVLTTISLTCTLRIPHPPPVPLAHITTTAQPTQMLRSPRRSVF